MASMIYKMLPAVQHEGVIQLFKSSEPELFGDGEQKRDFIYVKDVVHMTTAFLDTSHGGIFNIGRGEATTWNALATALFKALGKPPRIEYVEMPESLKKQYQNYTCANMAKYFRLFKNPLRYTVEEGVIDCVRTYLLKGERW